MTRRLSTLAFVLPLVAYVVVYFVDGTGFHPNGDGYYSWVFARSLVFDGDFDFRNDYALCGDPFHVALDRGGGHLDDPFYVGPAVFWVPPLALLRLVFTIGLGARSAAAASCGGWMTALALLAGPVCGALSVWLAYRAARLFVAPGAAAATALFFAFSSSLFPYSTSAGHYSHVYLTATTSFITYVSLRTIARGPRARDALWLGVAMAIAVLHRLPAALYAVVPAAAFLERARRGRPPWAMIFGTGAGTVVGIGLTLVLYKYLYGVWFAMPQGPDYVHLSHAHPWLLLFGVHGGFFFWTPAVWLAVLGIGLALTRRDLRLAALAFVAAAAVETLVSSSPLDWHGNWSLGARRLLPLFPFVVVLASLVVARAARWLPRRRGLIAAVLIGLVLVNNIPASTTARGDRPLSQRELYGKASPFAPVWGALDDAGVDVALLPAELYFTARYGLPTRSYRAAIAPRFTRDYRTLELFETELDLRRAEMAPLVAGGVLSERGLTLGATDARVVFTAQWPFATHVRLLVDAPAPVRVTMTSGRDEAIGAVDVAPGAPRWLELALPAFDSGLVEWRFHTDGAEATLAALALEDRTARVPYGEAPTAPRRRAPARLIDKASSP